MIYQLSVSPESKILGWCYMKRTTMAEELGLTKQSILNLIDALITKGFAIRDDETTFLRTTRKWNVVYFTEGKETIPDVQKSLPLNGKESLPNNNSLNNNNHISKGGGKKFVKPTLQEVKDYFEQKGYSEQTAIKAFEYYDEAAWKDSSGKPVLNWKQKMISNWFKDSNKTKIETQERIKF